MILTRHVEDGAVILDEPTPLPNGTPVQVTLPDIPPREASGLCGIWEDERSAEEIVQDIYSTRTIGRETKL